MLRLNTMCCNSLQVHHVAMPVLDADMLTLVLFNGHPATPNPSTAPLLANAPSRSTPEHNRKLLILEGFTSNNSCNCLAPKLLILDPDSPMSAKFMNRLKFHLSHR
jgi:hypothetical protein